MTTPDTSSSGSSSTRPGAIQDAGTTTGTTTGTDTGTGTGTSARQQMREVKDQVVGQAKNTFQQARDRATTSLDESRGQVAEQIGGVAHAFRRTGEQLRGDNQSRLAGLTDTVAQQVEQIANYVRDRGPREMRADLERIARQQPAAVIGSAFAIGLVAARFFKSSETDTGEDYSRSRRNDSRGFAGAGSTGTDYTGSGYASTQQLAEPDYPPQTGGSNPNGGVGGGYAGA